VYGGGRKLTHWLLHCVQGPAQQHGAFNCIYDLEQVKSAKTIFDQIDTDHSGSISSAGMWARTLSTRINTDHGMSLTNIVMISCCDL